ncbi:uncharacterized protein BO97DRAFT_236156 [Aspergillus homomorphus CBS 101889]|uniref:MIT domain-containing protein n=1 Tax=Aspergillus homomorphus (strain CBS 101889) TaxID=1450537 RepID=A0A395I5J5_ASPHC|nr:hypothetical protein BO97DRAFT_236156 [Aspergillus homomorphus CBS 101889]RAL15019.1 hypothetical protein BO97DRAFT_236156 [Aspergillus homomorphus CBS 101889]
MSSKLPADQECESMLGSHFPQSISHEVTSHYDAKYTHKTSGFRSTTPTAAGATSDIGVIAKSNLGDNDIREGLGSLNRWSQSTISSRDSSTFHRRGSSRVFFTSNELLNDPMSPNGKSESKPSHAPIVRTDSGHLHRHHRTQESVPLNRHENSASTASEAATFTPGASNTMSSHPDTQLFQSTQPLPSLFQNPWTERSNLGLENGRLEPDHFTAQYASESHSPRTQGLDLPVPTNLQLSPVKSKGHERRKRGQSQKAMLSKALQKANTAVLLDNAANFEGAMEAYNDACQLLQSVMDRSDGGEDERHKLQEIRDTYMIRVTELQRMDFSIRSMDSKALPERPRSEESYVEYSSVQDNKGGLSIGEGSTGSQHGSDAQSVSEMVGTMTAGQRSPRRLSLLPSAFDDDANPILPNDDWASRALAPKGNKSQPQYRSNEYSRGSITYTESDPESITGRCAIDAPLSEMSSLGAHVKGVHETTSWLDTIDESGASSPSSTHSNSSSIYLRHRKGDQSNYGTEAEFDAALDAAVEAAYDESLELAAESEVDKSDVAGFACITLQLAKQMAGESEKETGTSSTHSQKMPNASDEPYLNGHPSLELGYLDDAEEEERLLDEMTRGYVMDDFEFGIQSKSALPRQPGTSSQSSRSRDNVRPTTNPGTTDMEPHIAPENIIDTCTSTAPNNDLVNQMTKPAFGSMVGSSVRARRLSGQPTTELKIETKPHFDSQLDGSLMRPPDSFTFRSETISRDTPLPGIINQTNKALGSASGLRSIVLSKKRNVSVGSFTEDILASATVGRAQGSGNVRHTKLPSPTRSIGKVPSAPDSLGRLHTGLGPFRTRNISTSGTGVPFESPNTPSDNVFLVSEAQKGPMTATLPTLPTPTGHNIPVTGPPSGGLNLFDTNIHSPTSPGSPNVMVADPPLPLEPCPESFLLRPFWLMRCIYQTIAHPRGGYISTKLFVPRDVWRVKNVKLRAVEEKVSSCDLLTAALLKLAQVDTYDADAVLEEMQSLESVLDQVQMLLSKKVGSEVGVQGAMALLKSTLSSDDTANLDALVSKPSTGPSKSYLTSWRKLRSKNSGLAVTTSTSASKESSKDFSTSNTVPMTSVPASQHNRRNVSHLQSNGANNYMGALARLCDAVQVLDQIAQQVEDPGLKHSSPTLVGLELSTRHAAEFFGFYICRFALNDIGLMLDKFIKRGSEWVLI